MKYYESVVVLKCFYILIFQLFVYITGLVMTQLAEKFLNVKKTKFEPHHRNNLANKFCSFSNYDFDNYVDS